jgi:hypothetical protein
MVDNGKISTIAITIVGAILAVVIADPSILQALLGNSYAQYGVALLAILIAVYNAYFPRNAVVDNAKIETTVVPEEGA